jgi:2-haloacid dehalogenase
VSCHKFTILMNKSRFKGAYCTVLEMEALTDLFGDMDVIDATLPGMADKIIASQAAA